MRAGPDELAIELQEGDAEIRSARWGPMHLARYVLPPGTDLTPFFAALPDGLCTGEHFGIVLEGDITVRYEDGTTETASAGDLYYWPAGHTGWSEVGVVFVAATPLSQVVQMEEALAAAGG